MGRGPNRIYHDDLSAEGELPMPQPHERTIEERIAVLEDQRAISADIHATLESETIAAANSIPEHTHLEDITRTLPAGFTKVMWDVIPIVSIVLGALAASGKLDTFAIGGMVVGPVLMAIRAWLDKEIRLKGVV